MASSTLPAFGTLIKFGDGATPEVFTAVAEVRNISGPGFAVDTAEVTHHASPGAWEEVVATIIRSGELSLELGHLPANATQDAATGLVYIMSQRTKRNWQLVFPTNPAKTWSFAGLVVGFEPASPHDADMTASATIKITGQPTFS